MKRWKITNGPNGETLADNLATWPVAKAVLVQLLDASDNRYARARIVRHWPDATTDDAPETLADALLAVLARLKTEDRLACVVAGKRTNDGRPAPLCPAIVSRPAQMCAGCAAAQFLP